MQSSVKMRILLLPIVLSLLVSSEAMTNYTGTDTYRCVECLCHARTGCWSRLNCASYSITFDYWKTAKSPVVDVGDSVGTQASYEKCMKNDMCVVNTIVQYIDAIGHMDCNCDDEFDCKDRLAIHLFGRNCKNPVFGSTRANWFNSCSRKKNLDVSVMEDQEGSEDCEPEEF